MSDSQGVQPTSLEKEIQKSYLDYAMSVIVGRALPDVRDGLKPVHRRVLYAMHCLRNDWNKPYKKSARVVGDTLGKYHPHGDSAIYDSIVRMAQDFSMRYTLIDGHGNFGSVDGDSAASMRYTEIRLAKITHSMLTDLDKETVDFIPNFDNTESMPAVLPAELPNLLINGSSGIAVGMATNIPPHNLAEVVDACVAIIDDPDCGIETVMQHIKGPDFPTAASIHGRSGIIQAYKTGRGKMYIRAKASIAVDEQKSKSTILIEELPYTVNKAKLCEKIGQLVREKRIEGITAVRDESSRKGMRVVIECRRGENAEVILNQLYSQTQMQTVFGINMVCLDQDRPKCMDILSMLRCFLRHREEVVRRRLEFEVRKARRRAHVVEGLAVAISNIDAIIALIKNAANPQEAKASLLRQTWSMESFTQAGVNKELTFLPEFEQGYGLDEAGKYKLSTAQAQAILDMRLHRLTGLERDKVMAEYNSLLQTIRELLAILNDYAKFMQVIREELLAIKDQYADARKTQIMEHFTDIDDLDLIADEPLVVTKTKQGYMKAQTLDEYKVQRRGGRGKMGVAVKQDDVIDLICSASRHDDLLCFTNLGRVYQFPVRKIPLSGRSAKGRPANNFIPLQENENIQVILALNAYEPEMCCILATRQGVIKKVPLSAFKSVRSSGIIAISLQEGDELVGMQVASKDDELMLFSDSGKAIRFSTDCLRCTGRSSQGVIGMRLAEGSQVIALLTVHDDEDSVFIATRNGYGKRTKIKEFRKTGRGGQGVIAIHCSERNGAVVAVVLADDNQDALLMSDSGTIIRMPINTTPCIGRNTQGVRLIQLDANSVLVGAQIVDTEEDESKSTED